MIEVLHPGFYSTIQDGGRVGYEAYGVPVSGSLDQYSAQLANQLLTNNAEDAVMEITMTGPQLEFQVAYVRMCYRRTDATQPERDFFATKLCLRL